ncbi:MAG TPA: hypothetical protein VFG74_05275 [Miltoncostaeaceae bacterium]|nr:hypothetical protein [Miltoncostaeaceae bacterium]
MLALLGATPGIILRLTGVDLGTIAETALYGLSIISAAFLLSWAAEASEVDISQGLAVAFIALVAVLPEYAVSMTFAWNAPTDPQAAQYAVANMTGGNRLLIGAAWPMIVLLLWMRTGRRLLRLPRTYSLEIVALGAATVYSFVLPLTGGIALYDTVVLAVIFIAYVSVLARSASEEPELIGPARSLGQLPALQRRVSVAALFVWSAAAIVASAEPFAEGLVQSGTQLGIDEFLLVQWLAPVASEAPEFVVAGILAWRGRAAVAMGALISSKVNQWTLLIGGLPLAYSLSGVTLDPLPLDPRQQEEMFLTAAQSVFAVAVLMSLTLSGREALLLFGLFFVQFLIPSQEVRLGIAVVYLVLAAYFLLRQHTDVLHVLRTSVRVFKHPAEGGLAPGEASGGPNQAGGG